MTVITLPRPLKRLLRKGWNRTRILLGLPEPRERLHAPVPRPSHVRPDNLREELAREYLRGSGLEIGAFSNPLYVPSSANVRYVDRWGTQELLAQVRDHPDYAGCACVPVDIIDDGQELATLEPESQDFIIANHFLEHVQGTIRTIERHLQVLRPGGILYLGVPDKRFTFDVKRPVTPLEHHYRDYEQGPAWSFADHVREWVELVENLTGTALEDRTQALIGDGNPSIHYHVWTQTELLEMLVDLRRRLRLPFMIEAVVLNKGMIESICVLRKV
jgi:SAM-dependent methyltransferase